MPTLATLQQEFAALDALLIETGGEVTPETEPILQAWFAELATNEREKADGYAFRIKDLRGRALALKAMAAELTLKERTLTCEADWLLNRMAVHLEMSGRDRLAGAIYRFQFEAVGGRLPIVLETEDPEAFPADCRRVVVTVDREAVRASLEAAPDGASLLPAHLGERGRTLRIR